MSPPNPVKKHLTILSKNLIINFMINKQKILNKFIQINNNVNWRYISYYYELSENFIRNFKNDVDWYYISSKQKLSENFIREFQDKVYWYYISNFQTLSEDFKKEFKHKLNGR
jgi:hypothetical protein